MSPSTLGDPDISRRCKCARPIDNEEGGCLKCGKALGSVRDQQQLLKTIREPIHYPSER